MLGRNAYFKGFLYIQGIIAYYCEKSGYMNKIITLIASLLLSVCPFQGQKTDGISVVNLYTDQPSDINQRNQNPISCWIDENVGELYFASNGIVSQASVDFVNLDTEDHFSYLISLSPDAYTIPLLSTGTFSIQVKVSGTIYYGVFVYYTYR